MVGMWIYSLRIIGVQKIFSIAWVIRVSCRLDTCILYCVFALTSLLTNSQEMGHYICSLPKTGCHSYLALPI